ncbi:hypothetical protein, partial [Klebsiella pneumoniae]|uniref:hypothetical protein n=1 Tax=Klebsiella pneumoniae TaxID=573 RepID=UPI0030132694
MLKVELIGPADTPEQASDSTQLPPGSWKVRYWYGAEESAGIRPYREWLTGRTQTFVGASPRLEEETKQGIVPA